MIYIPIMFLKLFSYEYLVNSSKFWKFFISICQEYLFWEPEPSLNNFHIKFRHYDVGLAFLLNPKISFENKSSKSFNIYVHECGSFFIEILTNWFQSVNRNLELTIIRIILVGQWVYLDAKILTLSDLRLMNCPQRVHKTSYNHFS